MTGYNPAAGNRRNRSGEIDCSCSDFSCSASCTGSDIAAAGTGFVSCCIGSGRFAAGTDFVGCTAAAFFVDVACTTAAGQNVDSKLACQTETKN